MRYETSSIWYSHPLTPDLFFDHWQMNRRSGKLLHSSNLLATELVWHYSDVIMNAMASLITGVSIVYSFICSGANQRKRQSFASLVFVRGIMGSNEGNASIWWRHHGLFKHGLRLADFITRAIDYSLMPCLISPKPDLDLKIRILKPWGCKQTECWIRIRFLETKCKIWI